MKTKTIFFCKNCGHESPKWFGRCPGCGEWNTLVEQAAAPAKSRTASPAARREEPTPLPDIGTGTAERLATGIGELDRALGGGIVPGAVVLVGGDPGIGKSTLLLQMSGAVAGAGATVLYVSGEESAGQLRMRADRLGIESREIMVLCETDVSRVIEEAAARAPGVVILDSIQTAYHPDVTGSPGSVSQVRESAARLVRLAKESGVPVFIVGHVTKEGAIAGPRILEHMVDTVLYFEGDKRLAYRILRATKNRYGSTDEIGVFEMTADGLREVTDPSGLFVSEGRHARPGSVVIGCIEGTRALMVEIQALTGLTNYNMPQRSSTGIDRRRLPLILAVLERRGGLSLGNRDVFVSRRGRRARRGAGRGPRHRARGRVELLGRGGGRQDGRVRRDRARRGDPAGHARGEAARGGRAARVHAGGRAGGAVTARERPAGIEVVEVAGIGDAIERLLGAGATRRGKRAGSSGPGAQEV